MFEVGTQYKINTSIGSGIDPSDPDYGSDVLVTVISSDGSNVIVDIENSAYIFTQFEFLPMIVS